MSLHPARSLVSRTRLGLVGAGSVAAAHVEAARDLPSVEIAAVCDVRLEAARSLAGDAPVFTDHRAMIAAGGLEAVVVTVPHALHTQVVLDAAAAGLHVLVEKPMATTVEDCTLMIEACRAAGVLLAVAHVLHFDPLIRAARDVVHAGTHGHPLFVNHRRTAHYEPGSRPAWFFDPALAGGGIVLNVGSHAFDRFQFLTGARVSRVDGTTRGRPGMSVETDAVALVGLSDGTCGTLTLTSRGVPFLDETEILLEDATLRISHLDGLTLGTGQVLHAPSDVGSAFRTQLSEFAAAAQGRGGELVSGDYGRSVVAAALALYASDRTGGVQMTTPSLVPHARG